MVIAFRSAYELWLSVECVFDELSDDLAGIYHEGSPSKVASCHLALSLLRLIEEGSECKRWQGHDA